MARSTTVASLGGVNIFSGLGQSSCSVLLICAQMEKVFFDFASLLVPIGACFGFAESGADRQRLVHIGAITVLTVESTS